MGIDITPTFVINSHKKMVGLPDNFTDILCEPCFGNTLQKHTAKTHCNTLQHTATLCWSNSFANILCAPSYGNTLQTHTRFSSTLQHDIA